MQRLRNKTLMRLPDRQSERKRWKGWHPPGDLKILLDPLISQTLRKKLLQGAMTMTFNDSIITLEQYDKSIKDRLDRYSKMAYQDYLMHSHGVSYEEARVMLMRDPDFAETRKDDEWTGSGRRDHMYLSAWRTRMRSLVQPTLEKNLHWKFVSSWLNQRDRLGGRSEEERVLWIRMLVGDYDLPFAKHPVLGIMISASQATKIRSGMRELWEVPSGKPSPQVVQRVMDRFDLLKKEPRYETLLSEIRSDMDWFARWEQSEYGSEHSGVKKVEQMLVNVKTALAKSSEKKTCPQGHTNPLDARWCAFCDEPYNFAESVADAVPEAQKPVLKMPKEAPFAQSEDLFLESQEDPFADPFFEFLSNESVEQKKPRELEQANMYQRGQWFARLKEYADRHRDEYRKKVAELRKGTRYEGHKTQLPFNLYEVQSLLTHFCAKDEQSSEAVSEGIEDLELGSLFPSVDLVHVGDEMWHEQEEPVDVGEPEFPSEEEINEAISSMACSVLSPIQNT